MGPTSKRIVAGFLITEQARFSAYLEGIALDETEGAVIIEEMLDEIGDVAMVTGVDLAAGEDCQQQMSFINGGQGWTEVTP